MDIRTEWCRWSCRLPASCIMLVLDTNIYLNERPHVHRMIERWQLLLQAFRPHPAILLIPRVTPAPAICATIVFV